jgi:hypothetical protein
MTTRGDVELVLDRWLAEGPTQIADRVVLGALETVEDTTQLRGSRWLPMNDLANQIRILAIAAAVAIVIGGGALLALALRSGPSVGAMPTPTATASGVTLNSGREFTPPFILTGKDGWYQIGAGGPGTAFFAEGPNEPRGPNAFTLALIRPTQVLPVGGGPAQALPADLIAWLQSRSDLVLQTPTIAEVGGIPATAVKGTVVPTAKVNATGNVNLLCTLGPCGFELGNELGVAPLRHFEIAVVDVRGQIVVIRIDSPGSTWLPGGREFDDLLPTIVFPG